MRLVATSKENIISERLESIKVMFIGLPGPKQILRQNISVGKGKSVLEGFGHWKIVGKGPASDIRSAHITRHVNVGRVVARDPALDGGFQGFPRRRMICSGFLPPFQFVAFRSFAVAEFGQEPAQSLHQRKDRLGRRWGCQ